MTWEVAAIIIAAIIAVIVAMIKFIPRKDNPGHNALDKKYVRKELFDSEIGNIKEDLGEIKRDVKELLRRG